ncbi:tyrosine-type recombinase/integrase [Jannaschia sp. R86511]|uniref:tyrosine-type recombinase/integrase n=1 Tax=Jannaschia sp. R86511 TaxID=3093853 RepID=UPI0036D282E8
MSPSASRLDDLAASFGRHLRAEGKAPRTAVIYTQSVTQFSAWLVENGRPTVLSECTRAAIREWLATLADRNLQNGTIRTRYKGLHRFLGWAVEEGELETHPMRGLDVPAAPAKPVPVLTDAELVALLKACAGKDWADLRDEAIVRLLLDCGIRVSELTGLNVGDIDLDREMALVTGKGNRIRPVYFGARTGRALDRWKRARAKHRWSHLDALFLSQRGALTADGVRNMLTERGRQAGIEGLHPHRFRHTFAHDFLVSGGQERDLKRLAGWTSDVMLERYGASAADARAAQAARRLKRGDRV